MAEWTELLNPIHILDIAIVAIFIYKLISMVKGTRAVQLIKGLLLLLVLTAVSSSSVLGLNTVNWILEQIKTMLLIAIPVVFQPELRRAWSSWETAVLFPAAKKVERMPRWYVLSISWCHFLRRPAGPIQEYCWPCSEKWG